jgi:hypothetical protein
MNVVDEFVQADAACRRARAAYPACDIVLLLDGRDEARHRRWTELSETIDVRLFDVRTNLYRRELGGLLVATHLDVFLASPADLWFKIDPDTFVRRSVRQVPASPCFFGTVQNEGFAPRPSLQGGCIAGTRASAQALADSQLLRSTRLADPADTWAGTNRVLQARAVHRGLVSFDFVHAWACEQAGIPLVDHAEIRSQWLSPPAEAAQYAVTHPHKHLHALGPDDPGDAVPASEQLVRIVEATVPTGSVVAVVADAAGADGGGRWTAVHLSCDGTTEEAIAAIEAARRNGATYVAIAADAACWRHDDAEGIGGYLRERYVCVTQQRVAALFELEPRRQP